ncbi:hypothetical protein D3C71_1604190 [compost metagenome]
MPGYVGEGSGRFRQHYGSILVATEHKALSVDLPARIFPSPFVGIQYIGCQLLGDLRSLGYRQRHRNRRIDLIERRIAGDGLQSDYLPAHRIFGLGGQCILCRLP